MVNEEFDWHGHHRAYLGIAPGAGAAHRMVGDAQALATAGYRVALGLTELGRLEPLARGLDVLPMRRYRVDELEVEAIDIDAVRLNPPDLVIMGNMAHYYGPAARYPHRLAQIQELLRMGCGVVSNVYAYEIEPIVPIYRRLTRLDPPTAIPARVLDEVEMVFVDADPLEMIQQLEAGELIPADRIQLARRTLYRKEVLEALRRATLSLLELRGPARQSHTTERVMVCVGFNPNSSYLLQRARRIADGLGADLLAVHVRPPAGGTSGYEVTLQQHLALAADLGAQTMVPRGRDVAATICHIARTYHVTAIIIGRPERSRWEELLRGSLLTQVMNAERSVDIYIVAEPPSELV